jgi:thiol-disulfide isomerase/thioredoxin
MRRWMGSLFAAVIVALPLMAQDRDTAKGSDKDKQRAEKFKEIVEDYKKAVPDVRKALQNAETEKERDAILEKLTKDFSPRIVKLVEADPKDNMSFEMLMFAVQALPKADSKVYELLINNWAGDAKIKAFCQRLMFQPQENAAKLLQKVLKDNTDKSTQGFACYALAKIAAEKAGEKDKKAEAEAEKYYERVVKDFADVTIGRDTKLGDLAKGSLFEIRNLSIGKKAPNVESKNLDDKKVQLSDYKGKVVVLDIWATWCGPCKAMIPHEREMVEKLKEKPFALISISADDEKKTLTDFLEKEKMPWTHWWTGSNGIVKDWNVQFFPTIYVIDAEGVIRFKNIRGKELEEAVVKLLGEVKK